MYIKKPSYRHPKYDDLIKRKVIELYEQGYGSTFIAMQLNVGRREVCRWVKRHQYLGDRWLEKQTYPKLTIEFKQNVVRQVLEKCLSCEDVALQNGVSESAVKNWVYKVKNAGYCSLYQTKSRGRPAKPMGRPRKKEPQTELEILREQNERLRTEVALLKKVKALVEAKEAQLKELGRKPSKN